MRKSVIIVQLVDTLFYAVYSLVMAMKLLRIHRTASRLGLLASIALGAFLSVFLMASASANGAGAKCYDALAGVATTCPKSTSFKIDGVQPGPNEDAFVTGKCYTIADTTKGWITSDCAGPNFKDVVPTQKTPNNVDSAQTGNCPAELDPQKECNIVRQYLNPVINALGIIVVLAVVISIVIGGIQYTTSADQPGAVQAARQRIINAVLALLAFTFLWSFLQWIIPGGIF